MYEENQLNFEQIQLLDEQGHMKSKSTISDDTLLEMYRWMLKARLIDEKLLRLQRQGRIGTYAPFSGQEAAQIGSALALEKHDWICPSYRDLAACMVHGMPFEQVMQYVKGHLHGGKTPDGINIIPIQIIIAAQTLHAVGIAFASKLKKEQSVSVSYFGDGATSEGDFHEALNFASVYQLPVVFFCQNNKYAISVPLKQQMASRTIAQKAIAYGMKGVQVDGNDVIGVYEVMKEAVDRARSGQGPTLIEADTYRLGPHTTSDDPNKYRPKEEELEWIRQKDPILRLRKLLEGKALWTWGNEEKLINDLQLELDNQIQEIEQHDPPKIEESFHYVYSKMNPQLVEQQKMIKSLQQEKAGDLHG